MPEYLKLFRMAISNPLALLQSVGVGNVRRHGIEALQYDMHPLALLRPNALRLIGFRDEGLEV